MANSSSHASYKSATSQYERVTSQPENPFAALIPDQFIAIIPSFTLESGVILQNVPLAYTTRGKLSSTRDNAMVICHALTGSADVGDWWGPLLGRSGRAFDYSRFYIICMNSLGSPYGTASPVTSKDNDPKKGRYGPEFPLTTIRDDVKLHKLLLDDLRIQQVAVVIGGSMGGMLTLEWAYFGKDYVRAIVPIATSSQHSAWGISWGEAQRQSIYSDPKYEDGYYSFDDPPSTGLAAARMSALLTYRSRDSFESRFGRNISGSSRNPRPQPTTITDPCNEHWKIHNDGHKNAKTSRPPSSHNTTTISSLAETQNGNDPAATLSDPQFSSHPAPLPPLSPPTALPDRKHGSGTYFSAQSYLRYQGEKFVRRFDSNCYIAITRKLDTHDVSRHAPARPESLDAKRDAQEAGDELADEGEDQYDPVSAALALIAQPTLVLGIRSDGLFTFAEQQLLADAIPNARLRVIESPEGHDAFLLQFEQVNRHILEFLRDVLPDLKGDGADRDEDENGDGDGKLQGDEMESLGRTSVFGEAEVGDITAW